MLNRHVSIEDRRFIKVVLTDKGKSLEEPILKVIDDANHDIMLDIPQDEQDIQKKNLRLLAGLEEI